MKVIYVFYLLITRGRTSCCSCLKNAFALDGLVGEVWLFLFNLFFFQLGKVCKVVEVKVCEIAESRVCKIAEGTHLERCSLIHLMA